MRTCIFCGGAVTTREHAWPDWIRRALSPPGKYARVTASFGPESVERSWHGLNAAITVKYLCDSTCNNGWMAALEHRAKPYLLAMMRGLSITLDREAQTLVAAWALKTAMVFECTNPTKNWFFSDEERQKLRATCAPGLGILIWLGRSSHTGWSFGMANRLSHSEPDTSIFSEGYVNTFAMNHLVIQLLTLRRKPEFHAVGRVRFSGKPGPWSDGMVQIWPIGKASVSWPPEGTVAHSEDDLERLAKRFGPN